MFHSSWHPILDQFSEKQSVLWTAGWSYVSSCIYIRCSTLWHFKVILVVCFT